MWPMWQAARQAARTVASQATRRPAVSGTRRYKSAFASVDGQVTDATALSCSVWDMSFQRGDGVFEAVRVVDPSDGGPAKPRCVALHLDRMERSAAAISLPLPPRAHLEQWLREAAAAGGSEGYVRAIVTRGGGMAGYGHHLGESLDAPPRTFVFWQPTLPTKVAEGLKLLPACAPWHPAGFGGAGGGWETIKWLAYGANVHSTRLAQQAGYDDAVLLAQGLGVTDDQPSDAGARVVLDGPNFAIGWLRDDGAFCTPSWAALGMLQSCTCTIAVDAARRIGMSVDEGVHRLEDVQKHAKAVWTMSTGQDLTPVSKLGRVDFKIDVETRAKLRAAMAAIVDETP